MINFTLNVGIMYIIYTLTVLIVKLFSKRSETILLPEKIRKSFKIDSIILFTLMILEFIILFIIVFKVPFIFQFSIPLPYELRTFGVFTGYLGTIFISLTLLKLKKVYSATLSIRNDHELVQDGIYKYIRHPIYTGFILLHIGVTLSLSNIIVAIVWILGLFIFLLHRVPKEEELLEYYFQDTYRDYKTRTGMFFPKIFLYKEYN